MAVFCTGSKELQETLERLWQEELLPEFLHEDVKRYRFADNDFVFVFYSKAFVKYRPHAKKSLLERGFKEVSPEGVEKFYNSVSQHLSIIGGQKLAEAISNLANNYDFKSLRIGDSCDDTYIFKQSPSGVWYFEDVAEPFSKKARTVEEFIEYWKKILPKKEVENSPSPGKLAIDSILSFPGGSALDNALFDLQKEYDFEIPFSYPTCTSVKYAFYRFLGQPWKVGLIPGKQAESIQEFVEHWRKILPEKKQEMEHPKKILPKKKQEMEQKPLVIHGSEELVQLIDTLQDKYSFFRSVRGTTKCCDYTFRQELNGTWNFDYLSGSEYQQTTSIQEFLEYWSKILPNKVTDKLPLEKQSIEISEASSESSLKLQKTKPLKIIL